MNAPYHINIMKQNIKEFNVSIQRQTIFGKEIEQEPTPMVEKEYKMPFEMKVFKKRVAKHNYYRNRHKEPKPVVESSVYVHQEHINDPKDTSWSKLSILQKKSVLRTFLQKCITNTTDYKTTFQKIWKEIRGKRLKVNHLDFEEGKIVSLHGFEKDANNEWHFEPIALMTKK